MGQALQAQLQGQGQGGQNGGQQQQPSIIQVGLRMLMMYYLFSWLFGGNKPPANSEATNLRNSFKKGEFFDLRVYLSEGAQGNFMSARPDWQLYWEEKEIQLAQDTKLKSFDYEPSDSVKSGNCSIWMSLHFTRAGYPNDPEDDQYDPHAHFVEIQQLNKYAPQPKVKAQINLLSGEMETTAVEKDEEEKEKDEGPWLSYWKPNITISMVDDFKTYQLIKQGGKQSIHGLPPQISAFYKAKPSAGVYQPVIWMNEFWLLHDYLIQINQTTEKLTLHLQVAPIQQWLWNLLISVDHSFDIQKSNGLIKGEESDEFKRIILEGNPILLGITFAVSMLHMVFDFLAFKSDIGFWYNNRSMEGLSANIIVINAFCSLIVTLYLFDNETSFVVLISTVLETGIAFWKVTKAYDISVKQTFPFIVVKDRSSYVESKTKQYDKEATRYLSYVLFPLIIGYSIYSLVYQSHKSWYSFVVTSLVGAVYMFGFILMCPQLYLNYKLKSVAHLPWRQMSYKFLNTIIDDLFAFVIKMPTLHRISVFRDDLVFLVYLYQRWIYPVDKTRVNEFGYVENAPPTEQPAGQITDNGKEKEEEAKEEEKEATNSNEKEEESEEVKESKKDQ